MNYISTRGGTPPLSFSEAVITGLAGDGGLLLPDRLPDVREYLDQWQELPYAELANEILSLFVDSDIPRDVLRAIIGKSYRTFSHPEIVPVVSLNDIHVMELFHGPTLAFKDLALQCLGNFFEHILERDNRNLNILGATSGDTGSAAIHAVRGKRNINIFMLHPRGRISAPQELQMTTVLDDNVFNIAIDGSFDDGQKIIKEIFADVAFKKRFAIGAVNSVNWARVAAQIVYYFYGVFQVIRRTGQTEIAVCVPTGNFGNVFAGFLALRMGAPISQLILATNANDILSRFINTGIYSVGDVCQTYSPSMDIQVASNFERYLFYLIDRDSRRLCKLMSEFATTGSMDLSEVTEQSTNRDFLAGSCSDEETLATIKAAYENHGYLADPHTAVGIRVAENLWRTGGPVLCLATAHPSKFGDAICRAIGSNIARHPQIEALFGRPTRCERLPASTAAVASFIENKLTGHE